MADTSAYVAAQRDFEEAESTEGRTRNDLAEAERIITMQGPALPASVLTSQQIQARATKYANRDRAKVAHDAAVADLEAATATRDAEWAALVAAS